MSPPPLRTPLFLRPPNQNPLQAAALDPLPAGIPAELFANLHPAWAGWFTDVWNTINIDTAAISAGTVNIAGSGGGTTGGGGGTILPIGTPTVTSLPVPPDPLCVIGHYVILDGIPYIFSPDPSGGPTGFWKIATVTHITISDTHANRVSYPAANYPVGAMYFETDTLIYYAVQMPVGGKVWMYYNGIQTDVLANIPALLGVNDANYTFEASDYEHRWVWTGTAWNFAPGSSSGYFIQVISPSFLPIGLWGLCDGSTYAVSQNDATTTPIVTPIFAGQYIRR